MDSWPTKSMNDGYGYVPKAKTRIPESGAPPTPEGSLNQLTVVELISEIVRNADIVGHEPDGRTVYILHLTPKFADTLAALFAHLEDGDELDRGEGEHDGREPDPEDV